MPHEIVRVRHELHRRSLTVQRVERVTPGMLRIHLGGPELAGFKSLSPDDHVKLFVPGSGGERRDYTPRRFDSEAGELSLDFALHEAGPATRWALGTKPGDIIEIGGPRGSMIVPFDFDWWLLVGDETALPAIGRRLEELPQGVPVTTVVAIAGQAEEQRFDTAAAHRAIWVHRPLGEADDPARVLDALAKIILPPGDGFVWAAAEAGVARAIRVQVEALGHPSAWLKASGYWKKGVADVHEKIEG
ncbi:NADPH-dependent ferric siderophore reductase [Methylobacterium sp. PvP062]|uniref:NADPH-dependent ferric siderophore reductase n=1 Tax=Methylobacterium radiotolerans TaxID=31998 RepID=A0ABV2NUG9_9HYPH|nr:MULTISPECIES: siderophore-interacting protein [unclassified Methylobacterium]MBP2498308.1 NADPH-dependent ferric siderophore reductase [Methylobacterium sp. PvP105]MBP2505692.1 NADPH-dependent ferric siderophore reductase [Methylobacterium sp. PvP109]